MERVEELARSWGVVVERQLETQTSFIVFGRRGNQPVVLKVLRRPGDEWRSGEVLDAFDGNGIVRVYQHVKGAVLLERLDPGTHLADMALNGRDEEATDIVVEVIQKMSHPTETPKAFSTVEDWGMGFDRYLAGGDNQIPISLVERGQQMYSELCGSQTSTRLLHGDLQHYNILFDSARGWLAIDPKGVIGEIEYEIGASLRNPYERPELFASTRTIERRVKSYEETLRLNPGRALAWGFAQSVLSAIWSVEDGYAVDVRNPSLILANAIWPMLP
ncbi:MAG TPA: aminoglycoside phosphotransferase family protein [Blastocatellia bacterium]|nr:aminoglycoside phosphotransferase family protein [Blastocatellia bacterium]